MYTIIQSKNIIVNEVFKNHKTWYNININQTENYMTGGVRMINYDYLEWGTNVDPEEAMKKIDYKELDEMNFLKLAQKM